MALSKKERDEALWKHRNKDIKKAIKNIKKVERNIEKKKKNQ